MATRGRGAYRVERIGIHEASGVVGLLPGGGWMGLRIRSIGGGSRKSGFIPLIPSYPKPRTKQISANPWVPRLVNPIGSEAHRPELTHIPHDSSFGRLVLR